MYYFLVYPPYLLKYCDCTPQNMQPIERTYPPYCKSKVVSLNSFCIRLLYKCIDKDHPF